ncbi:hypothetical protein [uncultured Winogradskyella sp.]|uniref:hypothetical protein n=1 Tax=uncultured Winogradskyella sp. TaxID=395353 RepID=UPI0026314DA3|nr:hypothetical protein [uncultured Winogradskyella sp.]
MKNLKFAFFSMFMALFLVTACTNNEPVGEDPQQQTEESQSITTSLDQLRTQFDANGNVTQTDNPSGNIVLDFCFDFVYPLTLSYNNGATVTVEDLDDLIDVMLASTDELYIDGIAFPFDVETFNDDTDSIEIETINDEEEFIDLLEDCDFDEEYDECEDEYDPVCVEVTGPDGETFIVTYPNECYAECDGFDEDDFLDDCEDDYYVGGFECFSLNFPISVVTEDGDVITVNSEEELGNALYDVYVFDFVYPFTVTVYEDDDDDDEEEIVTINSAEDFEDVLEDCYDDYYDDDDYECEECEDEPVDPVCIEYTTPAGETIVTVFPNMCFAECEGFTEDDVVECDDNVDNCTNEGVAEILTECPWEVEYFNGEYAYIFNEDGTFEVTAENGIITTGTWSVVEGNTGYPTVILDATSGNFDDEWAFIDCYFDELIVQSLNDNDAEIEIECN